MPNRTCRYCRFSASVKVRNKYGEIVEENYLECQRNPPNHITIQDRSYTAHGFRFPVVNADDSCGEWKSDSVSPEAEARNELRQQLVVAMVAAGSALDPGALWEEASRIADCDPEVNDE